MPNPEIRMRLDADAAEALDGLARELGLTRSGVVRLAIVQLARAQRLTVEPADAAAVEAQRRRPGPKPRRAPQANASE